MNPLNRTLAAATVSVLWAALAVAQSVTLSVPDTIGRRGDTLRVPVYTSTLNSADSIYSGQFTVSVLTGNYQVLGVDPSGSVLASGGNPTFLAATGKFGFASASPVTGNGALIYLVVRILPGSSPSPAALTITGAMLNEGSPSVGVTNGSVRPYVVSLSPKSPVNTAVGDSVLFTATGDVALPIVWSVSDTALASIGSDGWFRAKVAGSVKVFVVDARGVSDSTTLFAISVASLKSLTISVPDTGITQTLLFGLPVRVTDVTGLGITSVQFRMSYSASSLEYLGTTTASTIAAGWGPGTVNAVSGQLDVALAGADSLTGSGPLIYITFRVRAGATGTTAVTLSQVLFNETINATIDNGSVLALAAPAINVTPAGVKLILGEGTTFVASGAGTPPYWYSLTNAGVGSIDSVSGSFTATGRGATRVVAHDVQGFTGLSDTMRVYDFRATLPVSGFLKGDSIDVPVTIGTTDGLNITSFQFTFLYDTTVLSFRGAVGPGTLSAGLTLDTRDTSGRVTVAGAGVTPLTGSGVLVFLRFGAAGLSANGDSSSLAVTRFEFNEPGASTALALPVDGKLGVIVPNTPPVFTSWISDTTIAETATLTGVFTATDADGDTLRYHALVAPSGATVDSVTGAFVWTTTYTDAGLHALTVTVSDGIAEDTVHVTITVVNVDRPPTFTAELTPQSVLPGQTINFTYSATDPDGDAVRFHALIAPSSATLDSTTGALAWSPVLADSGDHVIRVVVSDGTLADTTEATVNVIAAQASTNLTVFDYAVPGALYKRRIQSDGTPAPTQSAVELPAGMVLSGDTLIWTPAPGQIGFNRVILDATNLAGTLRDTLSIFVEAVRAAENLVRLDVTHRGKVGAFALYGKGMFYGGKNAIAGGDLSFVDRNSSKYAGGLYSTLNSFRPDGPDASPVGFTDTTSRFAGFAAFATTFSDQWEPSAGRIGLAIRQVANTKVSAPDDRYSIVEYLVRNVSGSPIDDLFPQLTADFDVGDYASDVGGYDPSLGLLYVFEQGAANDSAYYGIQLLSTAPSGVAVFNNGQDSQFIRSTANLTTMPAISSTASDVRLQFSAGPFALTTTDTLRFAIAFLAANNLPQLQAVALQAKTVYQGAMTSAPASDAAVPAAYELSQNYPNPFNPSTTVRYGLPSESRVSITVFDQLGREVGVLVDGVIPAGQHETTWQAGNQASGLYYFRIAAAPTGGSGRAFIATRKMVLLK